MNQSASLLFPFQYDNENECLRRAETIEDTLMSAIRIFLLTRKGSRVGTKTGSFVPELLYQNLQTARLVSLADELKQELTQNFQGVQFLSTELIRDLSQGSSDIIITIKFTTAGQDNISDLIITLPSIFDSSSNRQNIL